MAHKKKKKKKKTGSTYRSRTAGRLGKRTPKGRSQNKNP